MDALSAIKMMTGSTVTGPSNDLTQSGVTPSISTQDLQKINSDLGPQSTTSTTPVSGGFQNLLTNFFGEVNDKQAAASDALSGLMSGKNVSLHQAMISMEEASVSFQMMVEVRNKLLDSYQELMRMQV